MTDLPEVKLKSLVNFPANASGRTGVTVVKSVGQYLIDLDYTLFQITPTVSAGDMPNSYNLIWDEVKHTFAKVPFALQATAGVASLGAQTGIIDIDDSLLMTGSTLSTSSAQNTYATRALAAAAKIPVVLAVIHVLRYAAGYPLSIATYIPGSVSGPGAFAEANGHYWELDLSAGVIDLFWLGAGGGDSALDTAALTAAVLLGTGSGASAVGLKILFGFGSFEITAGVTIARARTKIVGEGTYLTTIKFTPTTDDTLFYFHNSASVGPTNIGSYACSLSGMTVTSSDTSHIKTCIKVGNNDITTFNDIIIVGFEDATVQSVGLHYLGRDFCRPTDCRIGANKPIRFSPNPDRATYTALIDTDLWQSRNLDLTVTPTGNTTCHAITIDTGCNVTRMKFSNTSIQGGLHGLYWSETGEADQVSFDLMLDGFYTEQGTVPTGSSILIDFSTADETLFNVWLRDIDCDGGRRGLAFFGGANGRIPSIDIKNCSYFGSGVFLQMDGGVLNLTWENLELPAGTTGGPGATISLTAAGGVTPVLVEGRHWLKGAPLPAYGSLVSGTRYQVKWKGPADVNGYQFGEYVASLQLANGASFPLPVFSDYTVREAAITVFGGAEMGAASFKAGSALSVGFASTNFVIADTGSKLCVIRSSDTVVNVKNRLAATDSFGIKVEFLAIPNP